MRSESENPSPLVCCGGRGRGGMGSALNHMCNQECDGSFQPNSMNHMIKADKTDTQADAYAAIAGM